MVKKVLTIAGSDSSGGAGIQADIKTVTAHKMYAMSALTALTAQNTVKVSGVLNVSPEFVALQLDSIFTDIFPDAVKIGMVSSPATASVIADKLIEYNARNIVVDPVMVSTSGCKLIADDTVNVLIDRLFPLADVITPNIPEAEILCGFKVRNESDMEKAAQKISKLFSGAVLLKGGHLTDTAADLLYCKNGKRWLLGDRIDNPNTHGTGCTLSSAIACNLADGRSVYESCKNAKDYVSGALAAMLNLGGGSGPLDHTYRL